MAGALPDRRPALGYQSAVHGTAARCKKNVCHRVAPSTWGVAPAPTAFGWQQGFEVVGVDLCARGIDRARQRAAVAGCR